ncbi:TPA: ATP-binding cassette domain-containing protein [Streptococcus suis]|uniref:ABC transporter ATP-binding protein n=1 Tax=Streptococcus suis TaxID=1307 RepID=UPI000413EE7B|nr:ATP-binding cassette domain-containing protein [Streptococcus suis]MDW8584907.1 ATP-binding cassette domain-containing protein [Streptococcus suis]MDW8717693.1 ATP-binding cassette domain-containing protein [Streptococcus suis]MDW8748678.1 ATP-binding cassette domain-containing protein [Streptococcus suis]MDW8752813.1 ATP-binding cassette domain-containing protein [Streptococcus suis]MDW8763002.1 ATP-binding cassette domain-containing protein [Streptococcus suis]
MSMISVQNVSKKFDSREILRGLSFDIEKNEFVALVGPSGSGKSTILNMIGLLDNVDSGKIQINGKLLPKVNSRLAVHYRRNVINYLFQSNALISTSSVKDNLMLAMTFTNFSRQEKEQRIKETLEFVGLQNRLNSKINELSGGEQQRIAVVRAILKPGDIVLADEPTGSLDPEMSQKAFDLIRTLRDQFGKTILIVTHNMEQAMQCDRVISLESVL